MPVTQEVQKVIDALQAEFDESEVKWKPQVVSGDRAMAIAYIDARCVQDRLDDVVGVTGWKDEYECLADGSVVCRLSVCIGGEWYNKMDVGGPSEQPDAGDRRKAAFSDALKRAAVKFGIGRYLYSIPQQWYDYDRQKKQFRVKPRLPSRRTQPPQPQPQKSSERQQPQQPQKKSGLPTGSEFASRLVSHEAKLVKSGLCKQGDLVQYIINAGVKAGYSPKLETWPEAAVSLAVEETRRFESSFRSPSGDGEI